MKVRVVIVGLSVECEVRDGGFGTNLKGSKPQLFQVSLHDPRQGAPWVVIVIIKERQAARESVKGVEALTNQHTSLKIEVHPKSTLRECKLGRTLARNIDLSRDLQQP